MSDKVYEIITEQMIKALEAGTVPWRQPWRVGESGPRNIAGRPYRGINVFLTLAAALEKGYTSPYWLTFNQIKERGGTIRDGKSTVVIFWRMIKAKERDEDGKPKTIPMLRYYRVFNLDQVDGINPPITDQPTEPFSPVDAAEKIIANYPNAPDIRYDGTAAFYLPGTDKITLPPRDSFESPDEFYSTAFHELVHSTGHESRTDRFAREKWAPSSVDVHAYGREELVAEMGSAFLAGETGILPATIDNSAAYLRSWIRTIREDPRAVVIAGGAAQRAVDYILDRQPVDYGNDSETVS